MKRIILFAIFAIASFTVSAQTQTLVRNNTNCRIKVTPVCYVNQDNCPVTSTCPSVTINSGSFALIAPCNCNTNAHLGFQICWDTQGCTTVCGLIAGNGSPACSSFPLTSDLSPCGGCKGASGANAAIFFNAAGDLIVQ